MSLTDKRLSQRTQAAPRPAPPCLNPDQPTALLLDYDGTLTPIVPDPTQAQITPQHIQILKWACHQPAWRVAVVSGRSVGQLQQFLAELSLENLWLAGLHGGELYQMRQQHFIRQPNPRLLVSISHLHEALLAALQQLGLADQVLLEDKLYSLALHVRQTPPAEARLALEVFHQLVSDSPEWSNELRLQPGKQVLEAVPNGFNKGEAIRLLVQQWREDMPSLVPVFVGDDLTDEDGFQAVNALEGCSIRVGSYRPDSLADYQLPNVEACYQWLASGMAG